MPLPVSRNQTHGILLKIASVTCFVIMATCLKAAKEVPVGQLVFARSFFALIPIFIFLAMNGELKEGFKTKKPFAHLLRSILGLCAMGSVFLAFTKLPLPEATTILYANPLILVALSAIFLKETVRLYRWSAIFVGLIGVLIVVWPRLTLLASGSLVGQEQAIGAIAALCGAFLTATAMVYVRKLTETERSTTIVLYFAIFATIVSLASMPYGWLWPTQQQALLMITAGVVGGFGQIMLTESFRRADMSIIAPFEYTSLLMTLVIGYVIFADIPTIQMISGGILIIGAGVFIIMREQQLGQKTSVSDHTH